MYARDRGNLKRLAAVLVELGARLAGRDLPPDLPFQLDVRTLENGANFTLDTNLGRLDILGDPDGARPYPEIRSRAERVEIAAGLEVLVAGFDDLMAMKRAAGRPKDQLHLTELSELRELGEETGPGGPEG